MWFLIMVVIDDEVIHYDITVSLYVLWIKDQIFTLIIVLDFPHMRSWIVFSVLGIYKLILSAGAVYTSN